MKEEKVEFYSDGQKITGILFTPNIPNPKTIISCHGFKSTKEPQIEACRKLCEIGFRNLVFDFRGRGESEGNFKEIVVGDNVEDLKTAIDFLDSPVGVYGSSYGGMIAILQAAKDDRIKTLVLRSPVTDFKTLYNGILIKNIKEKGFFEYKPGKFFYKKVVEDALKYNTFEEIKKVKVPLLIIHGKKDEITPIEGTEKLFKNANEPKELIIFDKASHKFVTFEYEELFNKEILWFNKWLT